ncbi:hypothetical protein THMIRHAS_13820 [Thiosulfatimonas sediminis]|uniref:Peptidoglycan binding-like domain-containing protein n=2 Tax=Thiosulfatimonas sediminis TaxID=2675054 RepID=A0A6F8PV67_9GAMM|nr:hypothetical protein THMIRHAS_13820 [Thiosulfatimonas sediminis]
MLTDVPEPEAKTEISSPADIDLLIEKAKVEERQRILDEQRKQRQQAEVFAVLKKQQAPKALPIQFDDASIAGNIDGKIYQACSQTLKVPGKFRVEKQQILIEPETTHQEVEPALYQAVEKKIELAPEQRVIEKVIPAQYKTVTEEVVLSPARERWVSVPAEFEVKEVRIKIKDGYEEWQPCYRTSPGARLVDGDYKCMVKVPDEYQTIQQKKLVKAKSVVLETIPAETKTVTRTVLVKPEEVVYKTIPAKYKTVTMQQQITQPKTMQVTQAAKYETVETRIETAPSQMAERKTICKADRSEELVKRIQIVLEKAGYLKPSPPNDLDVIDGLWGPNTAATLNRYQRDNGLAEGAITFEVLNQMGIMK